MNHSGRNVFRRNGLLRAVLPGLVALSLAACAETQLAVHTAKELSGTAGPPGQGRYKVGNPYQIQGRWYYPSEDMAYREEGIASWYGPDFHGKLTANGETYDMNALTAAHRTLPMPSFVRVTNLENGRAAVLRVNDRGPFAKERIIDVSRRAAQLLGFHNKGTTRVRVEVLPEESRIAKAQAMSRSGDMPAVTAAPRGTVTAQSLNTATPAPTQAPAARVETSTKPETARADFSLVKPAAAAEPAPLSNGVWIQAGAFSDIRNAEGLGSRLSSIGAVTISPVTVNGRELFRVRLGPYPSTEANRVLAAVQDEGLPSARVVLE